MEDFVFRLQEDIEASEEVGSVTVDQEDLEDLLKAYKKLKAEKEDLEYDVDKFKWQGEE